MVLTDPESAGVIISNIDGLGAEEASIFTTDLASIDGALFNSARLPKRSINLTVIPIATRNGTIEDHRLEMYKYFPIKLLYSYLVCPPANFMAFCGIYAVATKQPSNNSTTTLC